MTGGAGAWVNLGRRLWDVVVVGAGPAGSMLALELGHRGCSVLLLERLPFPRFKVCGACLNGTAQEALEHAGLGELMARAGAPRLTELQMTGWGRTSSVTLHGSAVLSREVLDQALVRAAVEEGVVFVQGVSAELGQMRDKTRALNVRDGEQDQSVQARVVVSAAGLQSLRSSSMVGHAPVAKIQADSRVGVGAVLEVGGSGYGPGTIYMVIGPGGYVGLVRQEDRRLNVAAAFDTDWVRRCGSPERAVRTHLKWAGMPELPKKIYRGWKGTPCLTRRPSSLGGERLFLVGDAAGYVEPFTGEGMGWALRGAQELAPLVQAGVTHWEGTLVHRWEEIHQRQIRRSQHICKAVAWGLRRPWIARQALRVFGLIPGLAHPLVIHTSMTSHIRRGNS